MNLEKTQDESFRRAQDNGEGEGSSSATADPKILGNQASKNEPAPEPRLLRYVTGTFDPDKKELSTLIVFRVALLGKDRLSNLRFGLDFRSPRTAQGVDDLLIVDYAPVDQISRNPRDELDNTRVLLSPSTKTIIWDLWTMRKSNDAISQDSHDFAVLLKRKSQEQLMAKLSLETKTQRYWLTPYKYRRSSEMTFDPGRKSLGIPRNLDPRCLRKADLKWLVNSKELPEPEAAPQEPEVAPTSEPEATAPSEPGAAPQEPEVAPAPEPETPAPEPETPAPEPETPAPEPETPAPEPEVPALEPEAPALEPEAPAPPDPESPQRKFKHRDEELTTSAELSLVSNSLLSANRKSGDQFSIRSGTSKSSTKNPKLLETVEDAIRRLIVPDLKELKKEQKSASNRYKFDGDIEASNTSGSGVSREQTTRRASKHRAHASGKRALVQYDYGKAEDNEIDLKEGEYITNIKMVDEDWWVGENMRGETGLFPSNYVELTPEPEVAALPELEAVPQEPEVASAPEPEAAALLSLTQLITALERVAQARWPVQPLDFVDPVAPPPISDEECCGIVWHRSNRCVRSAHIPPVRKYVVIGIFYKDIAFPNEKLVDLSDYDDDGGGADAESDAPLFHRGGQNIDVSTLSRRLHEEVKSLRGIRRFLSLKELCGFSIYKCDPALNTHIRVPPDRETTRILQRLYLSYCDSEDHMSNWINFTHQSLNGGRGEPGAGQYSIELVLGWSVMRIAIIALTPVVLSLIIGIYYQQVHHDVATAWIISTYIVAAGAIVVGVLGVATSLGHV